MTMPSFGQRESADAIRERVGPGARYSAYAPPAAVDEPPPQAAPWGRLLWGASLVLLVVVLIVAVLVALGL